MSKHNSIIKVDVEFDDRSIGDKLDLPFTVGMQMDIARTYANIIDPWVPYDTGRLSKDIDFFSGIDGFGIVYNAEYAAKQYYGEEFHHTREHHPLATSHWDKVAMQTEREHFVNEVQKIVKGAFRNGQK